MARRIESMLKTPEGQRFELIDALPDGAGCSQPGTPPLPCRRFAN